MDAMQAPLYSATGESKGQFDLPKEIFGEPGSRRILQQMVIGYQANQRSGTSSTKTRAVVSGGGRKPWKQKGTGNARSGSNRSPLWRKGGIIFGPSPRSYRQGLAQSSRLSALQTALTEKAKSSDVNIFESFDVKSTKTREAGAIFKKAGVSGRTLILVEKREAIMTRAFANLKDLTVLEVSQVNAWHLMAARKIILTKGALDVLSARWKAQG